MSALLRFLHEKGQLPSMPWLVYRWKGEKGKMWEESASVEAKEEARGYVTSKRDEQLPLYT
jgi:hypothetical protein